MYQVDDHDCVVELKEVPRSSVGAPRPLVVSDEWKVVLSFYLQNRPSDWDGTSIRIVNHRSEEPIAIVTFNICYAHMFGPPNDEGFRGHPLAARGLHPYGAFRIENSSWIRQLERMNSVHEHHKPEKYWERRHYVIAFHDSTFECVADGFSVTQTFGSIQSTVPLMVEQLWKR